MVAGPASVLVDGNGLVSAVLNSKEMDSHIEELTKAGTLTSIDTTVDATGQCVFPGLSSFMLHTCRRYPCDAALLTRGHGACVGYQDSSMRTHMLCSMVTGHTKWP